MKRTTNKLNRVYIEITNECNLFCDFCQKTNRKIKYMTREEFSLILSEVSPFVDFIYFHVKGEPLMHPDFAYFINLCERANKKVIITTNGTLLLENFDALSSPAVYKINISVHALPFVADKKQYLENLTEFCSKTNKKVNLRLWTGDTSDFDHLKKENVIIDRKDKFEWPSLQNKLSSSVGKCYGITHMLGILSNGDIVPCCLDGNGEQVLGNIFINRFHEILCSEIYERAREGILNKEMILPLCQKCTYRNKFK